MRCANYGHGPQRLRHLPAPPRGPEASRRVNRRHFRSGRRRYATPSRPISSLPIWAPPVPAGACLCPKRRRWISGRRWLPAPARIWWPPSGISAGRIPARPVPAGLSSRLSTTAGLFPWRRTRGRTDTFHSRSTVRASAAESWRCPMGTACVVNDTIWWTSPMAICEIVSNRRIVSSLRQFSANHSRTKKRKEGWTQSLTVSGDGRSAAEDVRWFVI
jgi:hypothetical protein